MTDIRRYYREGYIYFLTGVTHERNPILIKEIDIFLESIKKMKEQLPFKLIAWVFLPDHFHIIIDPKESNCSDIIHGIKLSFSSRYRKKHDMRSGILWQRRFWDHVIRNEKDMAKHINYIHFNPVKHGLVKDPFEYSWSSIHQFYKNDKIGWDETKCTEFKGNVKTDFGE